MIKRITLGGLLIGLLVAVLCVEASWSDSRLRGVAMACVFLPLLLLGFVEYARLARSAGLAVLWASGLFGTALIASLPLLARLGATETTPAAWATIARVLSTAPLATVSLVILLVFAEQMIVSRTTDAVRRVAGTLLGIAYLGFAGWLLLSLRMSGVGVLVVFLVAVKGTDIGAYFTGSFLGRHKLIPWLSPGKSWEGLAGGLVVGALGAWLVWLLPLELPEALAEVRWYAVMCFGALVGLAGQFGDLCESLLKRSADVKDSGALLPEFGGVLDVIDSPLLAAPVAWVLISVWSAS